MKIGVVVFPGSNCDHDGYHAFRDVLDVPTEFLWHGDEDLKGCDLVFLPGGFSYGDYLRSGALAALSPVMAAVKRHAERGGLVLGVCNGFQVLVEAGLLPGALRRNASLRFLHRDVHLRVERDDLPFTRALTKGDVLRLPIAHGDGDYQDSPAALDALEAAGHVVFRYVSPSGEVDAANPEWNPNGSARAIAGVTNSRGNVLGMMPHPERAIEAMLGNTDGLDLLRGTVDWMAQTLSQSQEKLQVRA